MPLPNPSQSQLPETEILRVRRAGPPATRVRAFEIDAPVPGKLDPSQGLQFSGWVAATNIPVTGVALFCNETLLRTAPLNIVRRDVNERLPDLDPDCGFSFALSPMEVPPDFELILYAVSENLPLVQLATLSGRHNANAIAAPSALRPLLLTSLGRSGTTYFMQLLSAHPAIAIDRTYPYEGNAASYWMHVFRAEFSAGLAPADGSGAAASFAPALHRTPPLTRFLNTLYPAIASTFCRNTIDAYYSQLAAAQNHPNAQYFCEKILDFALAYVFWNVYPQGRQVFLVRDFRDVVCSVLAFNAKRGGAEFGRERVASDEAYIAELRTSARALLTSLRSRGQDALLVRYEDLLRRPREILGVILQYLALENTSATIGAMIAATRSETTELKEHRTSASPAASIGRWQKDLAPQMQFLCRNAFDDLLPHFGYKLDNAGKLQLAASEN